MLTTPWALLALVTVPIVFGIYFFRTRSRRREVSSLFLWVDRNRSNQGGRRLRRLQLPLLIFLELLALLLLAVAAARPMIRQDAAGHPTAIILDCSYSMSAVSGGSKSVRDRAREDLDRMLRMQIGFPVQFVLAGTRPELVPGRAGTLEQARRILQAWDCQAPAADLDAAVSLVSNIVTQGTKILVVTDRPPEGEVEQGKLLWKSYGEKADNLAVIHANRTRRDGRDRLLLEIANFSDQPQPLRLSILRPERQSVLLRDEKTLGPKEVHRLRTGIAEEAGTIEIRLAEDALEIDNRLTLLPPTRRPVRVRIDAMPDPAGDKIRRAVESSGIAETVSSHPEIVFTAAENVSDLPATAWTVRILCPDETRQGVKSFVGPFIFDANHPLVAGLSLDGVIWSGLEDPGLGGTTILSAGEVPLVTEQRRRNGTRILNMQLDDRHSTLSASPAWPILMWNILKYRQERMPGLVENNLKLGAEAEYVVSEEDRTVRIVPPQGEARTISVSVGTVGGLSLPQDGAIRIPAEQVGVYRIESESGEYAFAVGTLSPEESDLLEAATQTHGNWLDEKTLRDEYESIVWCFLLAALACLAVHRHLVSGHAYAFTKNRYEIDLS